ncbi:DEAD/DEAH box helicase [Planococcus sp. SSTMD024]|uniref:DEAD/DEAH box helicase n=1 Tax=Planococcus sp. SSTMD024 TaxID=3242163 RepID=UPI00351E546C
MSLYENLILRIDEISIEEILGSDTVKLINQFNANISSDNMKKIILENFSPGSVLRNKTHRNILLDLLRENEVKDLLKQLGVPDSANNFENLNNQSFNKNSKNEKVLFSFLGTEIPVKEEIGELKESVNKVQSYYPLFEHQRKAIKKLENNFKEGDNRVILHMPTGSGKTRTSMNIVCSSLRQKEPAIVFWLASTEELCKQAADEFSKAWMYTGNRELEIYRFWGEYNINPEEVVDGIVIAGLPKIVSAVKKDNGIRFISSLANKAELIIMDEAHQAIAPSYEMIIEALFNIGHGKEKKLIGLSATPGRTWNDVEEDSKLADFFSRKKVTLEIDGYDNPVNYLVDQEYLANTTYKELKYFSRDDFTKELEKSENEISNNILKKLGEDLDRNYQIINAAKNLVERHQRIIIFAPSVESSDLISFVLQSLGIISYSITGKTDLADRRNQIENFLSDEESPMILVNYGVLTTGFDAPKTSAAIIARPTISLVLYSQMVGRAIRGKRAGGNKEAEIVTIIDQNLPGFKSVAEAFENWEDVWE